MKPTPWVVGGGVLLLISIFFTLLSLHGPFSIQIAIINIPFILGVIIGFVMVILGFSLNKKEE